MCMTVWKLALSESRLLMWKDVHHLHKENSEDVHILAIYSTRTEKCLSAGEKFAADIVLVTAPLGCLKAGQIDFAPKLPAWKTEAIQKLGFGTLNKVILAILQTCFKQF